MKITEALVFERLSKIEKEVEQTHQAIHRLISTIEDKTFMRPKFLESSPAQRTFGEKVERVCDDFARGGSSKGVEIYIAGYFDHHLLDKLKKILGNGGKVKIISPELTKSKGDKTNLDALKRMENVGAEVRIHPMLHARIFHINWAGNPWGVIVGSGDIKSDCLGGRRFDAGIWSNYPDIIKSTIDFFNRVWEDEGVKKLSEIG
jgi:hypothetical protein